MQNVWKRINILLMLSFLLLENHCLFYTYAANASSVPEAPQRIVVLPLFAEEMLLDMIGPDRIVGVGHEYYENGEIISPTMALTKDMQHNLGIDDAESVLALNPDLVVLYKANFYDYETLLPALEQAGVPFLLMEEPHDFDDVTNSLTMLGEIVCAPDEAAKMVQVVEASLAELGQIVSSIQEDERIRATYYCDYSPSCIFDVIAEEVNIISDGGNVFVSNAYYQEIDDRLLSEWNPDLIAFAPFYTDTDGAVLSYGKDYSDVHTTYLLEKPGLSVTKAIQSNNVHPLSLHNSHYMVKSALELAQLAYPHLFIHDD